MALVICQEEKLNIEKLLDLRQHPSDEMDAVFQGFKEDGFERSLQEDTEDDGSSGDTETTDSSAGEETPSADDSVSDEPTPEEGDETDDEETQTESEAKVAEEAFLSSHNQSLTAYIALESSFNQSAIETLHLSQETAGEVIGNVFSMGSTAASMAYSGGKAAYHGLVRSEEGEDKILMKLAKLGFSFGKAGLKHFAKGLLFALLKTAEGLTEGSKALYRYARKRQQSYQRFLDQIEKARAIIKIIKASNKGELKPELYEDQFVISSLKVGDDLSFLNHLKDLQGLNSNYNDNLIRYTQLSVANIKKVMNQVLSGKISLPKITSIQEIPLQGLKKSSAENNMVQLTYNKILPGDHLLYFIIPDESLTDYKEIKSAYHQSHTELSIHDGSSHRTTKDCRLLTVDEVEQYLNVLESICQQGISIEKSIKEVNKLRLSLKPSFTSYMDYLASKDHDLTIKDSLAEYVSLKTHFLDHVIIGGLFHIQDLNISVLSASMKYIRDSLTQYQD